jgi:hypothetical protein
MKSNPLPRARAANSFRARMAVAALSTCAVLAPAAHADHPTVAFGSETSGPINTISAIALPRGKLAFGMRHEFIDREPVSEARLASFGAAGVSGVHSLDAINSASVAFAYGVTDRFSLSVRLPWVSRSDIREASSAHHDDEPVDDHHDADDDAEADTAGGGVTRLGSTSGIGDVVVLGNWQAWQAANTDFGVQMGIKAPTGSTHESAGTERLETEFQPGSGSYDFLFGAALSRSAGRWGLHANLLFNLTTAGSQDTEIGDGLFYNLAAVYALNAPDVQSDDPTHDHAEHTHLRFDAVLEINGETRWRNDIGGVHERNSGGTAVYISPGLRANVGKIGAFVSVGYPIVDHSRGVQTEVHLRLIGGLSYQF